MARCTRLQSNKAIGYARGNQSGERGIPLLRDYGVMYLFGNTYKLPVSFEALYDCGSSFSQFRALPPLYSAVIAPVAPHGHCQLPITILPPPARHTLLPFPSFHKISPSVLPAQLQHGTTSHPKIPLINSSRDGWVPTTLDPGRANELGTRLEGVGNPDWIYRQQHNPVKGTRKPRLCISPVAPHV